MRPTTAAFPSRHRVVTLTGVMICLGLHILLFIVIWQGAQFDHTRLAQVANKRLEILLLPQAITVVPQRAREFSKSDAKSMLHERLAQQRKTPLAQNMPHPVARVPTPDKRPSGVASSERHLDMAAIYANIGKIAAEVDREDSDTPVGQLRTKPLYEKDDDNRIAQAIRGAARPDCRHSIANTGLLAPLVILAMALDKKDSGCKW
jgi:hypothetical protein